MDFGSGIFFSQAKDLLARVSWKALLEAKVAQGSLFILNIVFSKQRSLGRIKMYRADEGRDRFPGDGVCRGIIKETKHQGVDYVLKYVKGQEEDFA